MEARAFLRAKKRHFLCGSNKLAQLCRKNNKHGVGCCTPRCRVRIHKQSRQGDSLIWRLFSVGWYIFCFCLSINEQ